MLKRQIKYDGSLLLQRDLYEDGDAPYFTCNDVDGLVFNPGVTDDNVEAEAKVICMPGESQNILWDSIVMNVIRQSTVASPDFNLLISFHGITADGQVTENPLMEKLVTTCPMTLTDETYIFQLRNAACSTPLSKNVGSATTGKIQVNLPKRWQNYQSITLNKEWLLPTYSRRKRIALSSITANQLYYIIGNLWVQYDSDMQADFDDIRFFDHYGKPIRHHRWQKTDGISANYTLLIPSYIYSGTTPNLYMYYGDASATASGYNTDFMTLLSGLLDKDDWEDGLVTSGRSSPYAKWTAGAGTGAVESTSPISGSYSMKHTGSGSASASNIMRKAHGGVSKYSAEYLFKVTTQGTNAISPNITLWSNYEDINNFLALDTYWDSAAGKQKLRLGRTNVGTWDNIQTVDWLPSRLANGTVYHVRVIDSGSNFTAYINGTKYIDAAYSIGSIDRNYRGFGASHNSVAVFDNYFMDSNTTRSQMEVVVAMGGEQATKTVSPDTPAANDTSILFTTPADFSVGNKCFLTCNEYGEDYRTNFVQPVEDRTILTKGPNSLDAFAGIMAKINLTSNDDNSAKIKRIEYVYGVI